MDVQDPREYQMPSRRHGAQSANRGTLPEFECAKFGRRVEIQLLHGNFHAARCVIDEAERSAGNSDHVTLATPLASTELGDGQLRLLNKLEKCGIRTVGDLIRNDIGQLIGAYDISTKSVGIVVALVTKWRAEIDYRDDDHG